jgi:hypothetical protein
MGVWASCLSAASAFVAAGLQACTLFDHQLVDDEPDHALCTREGVGLGVAVSDRTWDVGDSNRVSAAVVPDDAGGIAHTRLLGCVLVVVVKLTTPRTRSYAIERRRWMGTSATTEEKRPQPTVSYIVAVSVDRHWEISEAAASIRSPQLPNLT